MTKWIILFFFISLKNISFSQNSETTTLHKVSESILEKKISFNSSNSNLEKLLLALSVEQNLKISFSNSRLKSIPTVAIKFTNTSTNIVLNKILEKSGFDYLLVGRNIVIIERKQLNIKPDSTPLIKAKETLVKDISGIDTVFQNSKNKNSNKLAVSHIYNPNQNLNKLPLKLILELRKSYEKELKWAKKYEQFQSKNKLISKDTIVIKKPLENDPMQDFGYFLKVDVGLLTTKTFYINKTEHNWKNDIKYKENFDNTLYPAIRAGLFYKKFMVGTGLIYQHLTIHVDVVEPIKKNPQANNNSGKKDSIHTAYQNKYSFWSVPLNIIYLKKFNRFFIGGGIDFTLYFYNINENEQVFLGRYFEEKKLEQNFYYKKNNLNYGIGFNIQTGFHLNENFIISANASYIKTINPISENTIFNFTANYSTINFSVIYFWKNTKRLNNKKFI